ncbi:MAG: oligosaccharide flippase family protein [Acidobacteria bacterium]|nr:oligosaccharide flippase family protein [Acidobacteriota bacterium]
MNLRQHLLRGGAFLAVRHAIGLLLGVGGVLLLTRIIGPAAYGTYTAALGISMYVFNLVQSGLNTYLIRSETQIEARQSDQAFTLLLLLSLFGSLAAAGSTMFLRHWMRIPGLGPVLLVLAGSMVIQAVALVPLAQLERALDFRAVAVCELSGTAAYYVAAIPLAICHFGVWAPVTGWWMQQLVMLSMLVKRTRYRPRLQWDRVLIREMGGYGLGYCSSTWIWQLRNLVNPLIVGHFVGAEGVAYVGVAVKVAEVLSFVKSVTWRMSIAVLGHVQRSPERLRKAISEGMQVQALVVGPVLLTFALLAPRLIPAAFGPRWLPVAAVFPFVAAGYLSNALFQLHCSALYVLKRNWDVAMFHTCHIVLFAGSSLLLVPRLGIIGYGLAEVAALPAYLVVHIYLARRGLRPDYQLPVVWWAAMAVPLFWEQIGIWSLAAVPLALLWPGSLARLKGYLLAIRSAQASSGQEYVASA